MYFQNRIDLGRRLGQRLSGIKGREPIVFALREQHLQACIGMAVEINAWVFPFLTEPVSLPGDPRIMGLVSGDGTFTWNPDISEYERPEIESEFLGSLQESKRQAFSKVNMAVSQFGGINKASLQGRVIVLAGDVVKDRIEICAAMDYLKSVRYECIYGMAGNVDPLVADDMQIKTDRTEIMDIVANMFDADHYFEQNGGYSPEESKLIVMNISKYWV